MRDMVSGLNVGQDRPGVVKNLPISMIVGLMSHPICPKLCVGHCHLDGTPRLGMWNQNEHIKSYSLITPIHSHASDV